MPDQTDQQEAAPVTNLSTEVGASLASVWARYVGARPANAQTEVEGNVVRWTLAGVTNELEEGLAASGADGDPGGPVRTMIGYRRDLSAAVAKTTHRRVAASISKQDAKAGSATETFVLERQYKKH